MNTTPIPSTSRLNPESQPRLPLWLKIAYSAFMAVLVPVYWHHYGLTNFLYFCDVALFLTLIGLWKESPLLLSLPAVGILLPQALWCFDFIVQLSGGNLTGMTAYMFDEGRPLYLRALSLFHGWLPFLLFFSVKRVGYDRRSFQGWTSIATTLCLIAFFALPAAGADLPDPSTPRNINYVFGMNDAAPQTWLHPVAYLGAWILTLVTLIYLPTHALLKRLCPVPAHRR